MAEEGRVTELAFSGATRRPRSCAAHPVNVPVSSRLSFLDEGVPVTTAIEGAEPERAPSMTWWDTRVSDPTAEFTRFFEVEFQAVVRTAYFIVHDRQRAEDVAQEAFTQLYVHWAKVAAYQRPDAWVRRVAIRTAVRAAGRERRRSELEKETDYPAGERAQDVDLIRAVRQLPPQQRAAVALFYFEDRPLAEIAHILDCTESTARVHLVKARRRLGDLLGEEVLDADGS